MKYRMHGANPDKLYSKLGIEMPERIIDFSTNTNVLKFNLEMDFDFNNIVSTYPDDECLELKGKLSSIENCSEDEILVCSGTNEFIYMLASLHSGGKAALLQPLYSEYEKALNGYNVETLDIFSIDDIYELEDVDLLYICNPNNPTGSFIDKDTLRNIAEHCRDNKIKIVLDEAYSFFLEGECETRDLVKDFDNIYIMKSLTKIFNLSGIRIGYVVTDKKNVADIEKIQATWSVNSIAQKLAMQYLNCEKYITNTKEYYKNERIRFIGRIRELGFEVMDTQVNFFLMKVDNDDEIIEKFMKKGVVTRHTKNFKTLEGKYIRVAVKTEEDNDYFLKILGQISLTNI
jgi:threonine-phosphate decarboxylase